MKPIFNEERVLLENLLNVELPNQMWRKAHALYLDLDNKDPLYRFRIRDNIIEITKDNTKKYKDYQQKGWEYFISQNSQRLNTMCNESIDFIKEYIYNNPDVEQYVIGYSSGKDSMLTVYMWLSALKNDPELVRFMENNDIKWEIQMANTSNDTAETYLNVKKTLPKMISEFGFGVNLNIYHGTNLYNSHKLYNGDHVVDVSIYSPEVGFYNWIKYEKDYFIPSVMVRNCCGTYKEGETKKIYPQDKKVVMVSGVRKFESFKRSKYSWVMDSKKRKELFSNDSYPKKWVQIAPIVEWRNEDVWMFLLDRKIPFNPMYKKGYHRVGCLICPFQQNYIDEITKRHYPKQWDRWERILKKNYQKKKIGERLKWSFEEWRSGRWKQGVSKIYEITKLKKTKDRVRQVASILGVSNNIAEKYFDQKCGVCGKNLNPTEIGMFLKLYGRFEDVSDNRDYLCRKHIIEDLGLTNKEYREKVEEFTASGCDLF